ncbi:Holliday junction branch migration protein RuvA [uncultured Helcococcus sp.]|uniref:Holliday junction branch migration protein RuvA n=1 Tax=uncultured Helcococcus sp. TaxID=1072508 RepID=UPI002614293B|nr:Holliday junction branch migration protein RuvA [uncultured Helcococcus sp.]
MFSYIIGQVKDLKEDYIVLENNNIGYKIYMPAKDISTLIKNEMHTIYTEFVVREDSVTLYGFISIDDLEMFLSLNTVSGIGPKAALAILSSMTVHELQVAIISNDINTITRAPGVGKKTASRLILELTDKIDAEKVLAMNPDSATRETIFSKNEDYDVAIEGLIGLGYSKQDAEHALKGIDLEGMDLSTIVKTALKRLS